MGLRAVLNESSEVEGLFKQKQDRSALRSKTANYCFLDDLQVTTYQELCKAALKTHQALFSSLKVSLQIALLELYNLERIMRYLNDFRKSEEKKRLKKN